MKILSLSDLHLDAVTAGRARRQEVIEYLRDAHMTVVREDADLVVFSGDAFDPGGQQDCHNASVLTSALLALATGGAAVVAIAGNHDVIDSSELFEGAPVTTLTPLRTAARFMPADAAGRVYVFERPGFEVVIDDWGVLALPYVSRAHLPMLPNWIEVAVAAAAVHRERGGRLMVVAHLVVPGATLGSESVEMARGQDQIFPFEMVAKLSPELVINGHYHSRQEVLGPHGVRVRIPGSPLRFTFGEVADAEKGFLVANFP